MSSFIFLLCLEDGMAPSLHVLAAFGIGAWTGESTICSLRVPVFHCPAGTVFPMWSFALRVPLHTYFCRAHEHVASVCSCGAALCVVPAIVLDVEIGAEKLSVFTLGVFNSLAVVGASADVQGEVGLWYF